jgi:hypothetical protein
MPKRSKRTKIAVGLIIAATGPFHTLLPEAHTFLEAMLWRLRSLVLDAIRIQKNRFQHKMYDLYLWAMATIRHYFTTDRLISTAWQNKDHRDYLVQELLSLKTELDTKERNFFLW